MRSALIGSATGAFLLLLSTAAYADPPLGVGAAITNSGFECFVGVVVEPGEATPILPGGFGLVLTPLVENTKEVEASSANGNINLSCHGRIEYGSTITGNDFVTGAPVEATIPPFDVACEAINAGFPGVCNGEGAAVFTAENSGLPCDIVPGLITFDWRQLATPSGRIALNCQYVEE